MDKWVLWWSKGSITAFVKRAILIYLFGPVSSLRSLSKCAVRATTVLNLCIVLGCAQTDTQGTRTLLSLPQDVPRTTEIETLSENEHKRLISLFGGQYEWPAAERHLNQILLNLSQANQSLGQNYRVTILNTPVINAFARPSGDIYVTRGLLALANDSSEIAAVMAHEIAHVTAQHAAQRDEIEKNNAVIAKVASVIQGPQRSAYAQTRGLISFAQFSRQQELDADEYGISYMAHAGYDPMGAVRILKLLARYSVLQDQLIAIKTQHKNDIFSTHPSTPDRIEHAELIAHHYEQMISLRTDRQTYLESINGMSYGDNPDDGIIKGQRFIHPRLGFTFIAPNDFTLENSSQAVVGMAFEGLKALRLDSVKLNSNQSLEDYLASGWVDGLIANSIRSTQINGLSAATALAQSGPWSFHIAVIRLGTSVYRLIYTAQNITDDVRREFNTSILSFKRISTDEAAHIHPLFIAEIKAQEGMKAENIAGQMATTDRPLEHFLLINGLEKGGQLKTNEIYKIIRD